MTATRRTIVNSWLNGESVRGTALTCDSSVIRSYSLILVFKHNNSVWLLESAKGISVTTSKHFSGVAGSLAMAGYEPTADTSMEVSDYPNNDRRLDRLNNVRKYVRMEKVS